MEENKKLNMDFQNNLKYILTNLENDILKANDLEENLYLEMSKNEIVKSLNYVYENVKSWQDSYNEKKYQSIINQYAEIESIISELELCLADYEEKFLMNGISYSIFQIGKILTDMKIRNNSKIWLNFYKSYII